MPMFDVWPSPYASGLPLTPTIFTEIDDSSMSSSNGSEEKRRRRKDYDTREKRSEHRPSTLGAGKIRSSKRRSASREREKESERSTASERGSRKVTMTVPEMERRSNASTSDVRLKASYPTFSKAHSREAVGSREDVVNPRLSRYEPDTPEATDLGDEKERRKSMPANTTAPPPGRTPPSPPLTAEEPDIRRSGSGSSMRNAAEKAKEHLSQRRSTDAGTRSMKSSKSGASLHSQTTAFGESEVSSMPGAFPEERRSTPTSGYRRTVSTGSQSQAASTYTQDTQDTGATTDSDATTIEADPKIKLRPPTLQTGAAVPTINGFEPATPTPQAHSFPASVKSTPMLDVGGGYQSSVQSGKTPTGPTASMPPPPPPPPMAVPPEVPRVDYLLKHGGLRQLVPKKLVQSAADAKVQPYAMYQSPALYQAAPLEEYQKVFSGINQRLDDYLHVLKRNGSIAVATGYRSVARRLLDKLSQIFARDISSERCDCVICKTTPQPYLSDEEDSGISWGEILEFVSGRRELPQWPPFTIQADGGGLGISGATEAPMQKLDIDVPEEYRDHYKRQNQKTKVAVQNWLSQQPEDLKSPPEEADEDTLMFAMMTKLNTQARNQFIAIMHGQSTIAQTRAPTPAERPATSSAALKRACKALQRLYRLDRPPRDCECAMYLLNNPHLHGMLATLAEVNEQEWEILTSGRFDGFLWSGAEAPFPPSASNYATSPIASRGPSRGANRTPFSRNATPFSGVSSMGNVGMSMSRGNTPFSPLRNAMSPDGSQAPSMFPTRGPTPGPLGSAGVMPPAPVQLDEDTEIAVIAEVERNLYTDMEKLEDAFEQLHGRAELVRQLLRERSAGLSMQAQMRRGSSASEPGVRLGTPASGFTDFEEEDDDGLADMASLAPDDSASQISYNRRHRKRHERRTPAPVNEEDEGPVPDQESRRDGRRSAARR